MKKAKPFPITPFREIKVLSVVIWFDYSFRNVLLNPARPTNPVPKTSIVVGSGMRVPFENFT